MGTTPNPLSSLPPGFEVQEEKAESQSSALPPGFEIETSAPQTAQPAAPPVNPALAGLPAPAQAVQQAELNASDIANMLTSAGQRMRTGAVPHDLRGYTPEELAQPGGFQNPRTGVAPTVGADLARVPVLDSPVEGGKQMIQGAEQAAEPDLPNKAAGATKILGGAMQAAEPALPGAIAAAPVATAIGLAGGAVADNSVSGALKKAGVRDEYADLAGTGAGLVAGSVAGHLAHGSGRISAFPPERATLDRQIEAPEGERASARPETSGPVPQPPAGFEVTDEVAPQTAAPAPPPGFTIEPSNEGAKPEVSKSAADQREADALEAARKHPKLASSSHSVTQSLQRTFRISYAEASRIVKQAQAESKGATPNDNRNTVPMDGGGQRTGTQGQENAQEEAGSARSPNGGSTEGQAAEEEPLGEHQPDYLSGKPGVYHGFRAAPEGTNSGREDNGGTYIAQNREYANNYAGGKSVLHSARVQVDKPLVIDRPEHAELLARAEVDADPRAVKGAQRDTEIADLAKYYAEKGVHRVSPRAAEILRGQGYDAITVKSDYIPGGDPDGPILIGLDPNKVSLKRVEQPQGSLPERPAKTEPAYGSDTTIRVPGEQTTYPARYAVREAEDVQPSHNAFNFERNPQYDYENDRDYTQPENASRVIQNGHAGTFDATYTTSESPTAEHGAPIIDQRGNALGGNSRTMTQQRVYEHNPIGASAYRDALAAKAAGLGINPGDLGRFKKPMLVRELSGQIGQLGAQKAITDFNKSAAAKLAPEEQAVADGRRMSPRTISKISGNLADVGEDSTLAQALRGDGGTDIISSLVKDGVITRQESNGLVDDRGVLTGAAKDRISKALVGRMFASSSDFGNTAPDIRNKLERVAPQVLRVEDRPQWSLTGPIREAVTAIADAKAHGIKNLEDLNRQTDLNGKLRAYSPDAIAVAKKLQEGPVKAQQAFRQYANDAELSRPGAQVGIFEPPTRHEAFEGAFGKTAAVEPPQENTLQQHPEVAQQAVQHVAESVAPAELKGAVNIGRFESAPGEAQHVIAAATPDAQTALAIVHEREGAIDRTAKPQLAIGRKDIHELMRQHRGKVSEILNPRQKALPAPAPVEAKPESKPVNDKLTPKETTPTPKPPASPVEKPATPVVAKAPKAETKPAVTGTEPSRAKTEGARIAKAMRTTAEGMQGAIEARRNPAIANQNPTARRARIAGGMAADADRMQETQTVLKNLAAAHENGTVPEVLDGVRTRAVVEALRRGSETRFPDAFINNIHIEDAKKALKGKPGTKEAIGLLDRRSTVTDGGARLAGSLENLEKAEAFFKKALDAGVSTSRYPLDSIAEAKRLYKAGLNADNWAAARTAVKQFEGTQRASDSKERQIANAETALIGRKIPGYFPTPKDLAARMVQEADIQPGMKVLEPSAGNGRIADEVAKHGNDLLAIEPVDDLRNILKLKGHSLSADRDFLEHTNRTYDRIVMNPPFEKGQDMVHVQHAYQLLKPGGRLVSIMGEHGFFATDKQSVAFRDWLEEHGGTSERLPAGSFEKSGTGVSARLVTVERPAHFAPTPVESRGAPDRANIGLNSPKPLLSQSDDLGDAANALRDVHKRPATNGTESEVQRAEPRSSAAHSDLRGDSAVPPAPSSGGLRDRGQLPEDTSGNAGRRVGKRTGKPTATAGQTGPGANNQGPLPAKPASPVERSNGRPSIDRAGSGELPGGLELNIGKPPAMAEEPQALAARSLKTVTPSKDADSLLRQMDSMFVAGAKPGTGKLYLNHSAMAFLAQGIADVQGKVSVGNEQGMTVLSNIANKVLVALERTVKAPDLPADLKQVFGQVAAELRKAVYDAPALVAVSSGQGMPLADVKQIIRHELIHRAQFGVTGNPGTEVDTRDLFNHPAIERAAQPLIPAYGNNMQILAAEIPAWLGAGQYEQLGLNREEAISALGHYFDLVTARHGSKALSVLAQVRPDIRKEIYARRIGTSSANVSGTPPTSGGQSFASRNTGVGRSGAFGSEQRPGGLETGSGGNGAVSERSSEGRLGGANSEVQRNVPGLFEQDEADRLAKSAASDRAQLEHDRLTAQLKAPLTREEQLRKLKPSKAKPQQDLFGPNAPPDQGSLFARKIKEPESLDTGLVPQRHFSTAGDWESRLVRNLAELRRASSPAFLKGVDAASANAKAAVILRTSMPLISKALAGTMPVEQFMRAGTEGRLRGRKDFYNEQAAFVGRMTDQQLERNIQHIAPLFEKIQDRRGLGRNLAQTLASLEEKGDYPLMRAFIQDTFKQAANSVANVMTPAEFNDTRHTPQFQEALRIYKERIETPMRQAHLEHEGVLTEHLGPLNTFFPLIPTTPEKITAPPARQAYARPNNRFNNFATGLADAYDTGMEAFRDRLMSAVRSSGRAAFHDALRETGLMQPIENGLGPNGNIIVWNGVPYYAVPRKISEGRSIVKDGNISYVKPVEMLIPRWLAGETDPILDKAFDHTPPDPTLKEIFSNMREGRLPNYHDVVSIAAKANDVAVSGFGEPVYHGTNLVGTLIANTPFIGESLGAKAASLPLLKLVGSMAALLNQHPSSEQSAADLAEMAKLGMLSSKFGNATYSRKFADETGAELNRKSLAPLLWGPSGMDIRARLFMYRLAKQIYPNGDQVGMHMFVNQLGVYAQPLQGALERGIKGSPTGRLVAPFVTAGTTMNRNGFNALFGGGPSPKGRPGIHAWKLLNSAIGLAFIAAAVQRYATGKWPWEDSASRLMEIPIHRETVTSAVGKKLYKALYGTAPVGMVKLTYFNPLAGRGARVAGVKGAADTALVGGKWWQSFEAAQKDVLNSVMHPFLGPVPRTAMVGLTGHEPSFSSLYDDQNEFQPRLYSADRTKGGNPALKRLAATGKELNSSFGGALSSGAEGIAPELFGQQRDKKDEMMRMVFDLGFPGLIGSASNPAKQQHFLRVQAAAANRKR